MGGNGKVNNIVPSAGLEGGCMGGNGKVNNIVPSAGLETQSEQYCSVGRVGNKK